MNGIRASAPGKVIVAGEYAVLHGAPAVAMAIDRRAHVTIDATVERNSLLQVQGVVEGKFPFTIDENSVVNWLEAPGPGLVAEVLESLQSGAASPITLTIDSTAFCDTSSNRKLGIGSSAAVTVALASAIAQAHGLPSLTVDVPAAIHKRFQRGKGSGVDIATSFSGGVIAYCMSPDPAIDSLAWPSGLEFRLLWSGRPADTADSIRRIAGVRADDETLQALIGQSTTVSALWRDGDVVALLPGLKKYVADLAAFDLAQGVGIFAAGHGALVEQAQTLDIVYKPCGAGGGDIGIALAAAGDNRLDEFTDVALARGFTIVDTQVDTAGVMLHEEAA